jgi:DNA-3-methyladenine glycosylase II
MTTGSITFSLDAVSPFRLDLTVWTLRRRIDNLMDRWDGQTYRRVLALEDHVAVTVAVTQLGALDAPRVRVTLSGAHLAPEMEGVTRTILERMLGLDVDLAAFYRFAETDLRLGPLVHRFRGVKPPRLPTVFETLVNAIACQQITLTQGIHLLNRLSQTYGVAGSDGAIDSDDQTAPAGGSWTHPANLALPAHAFPRPQDLAGIEPQDLKPLGFSTNKGRALVELARAICNGSLELEALVELDDDAVISRLLALRGVGRWTAEYVLLRGLGRTSVFPGDDVGARNNLQRWLGLAEPLDYAGVQRALAGWKPYSGLIYFHLLLDRLAQLGYLHGPASDAG